MQEILRCTGVVASLVASLVFAWLIINVHLLSIVPGPCPGSSKKPVQAMLDVVPLPQIKPGSHQMRVAVCVIGLFRVFHIGGIHKHLSDTITMSMGAKNVDYFLDLDNARRISGYNEVMSELKPVSVDTSPLENPMKQNILPSEHPNKWNVLLQFYRASRCFKAVHSHEHRTGQQYAWVIRTRTDVRYTRPWPDQVKLSAMASDGVWLNAWNLKWMVQDVIFMVGRSVADQVFAFSDHLPELTRGCFDSIAEGCGRGIPGGCKLQANLTSMMCGPRSACVPECLLGRYLRSITHIPTYHDNELFPQITIVRCLQISQDQRTCLRV